MSRPKRARSAGASPPVRSRDIREQLSSRTSAAYIPPFWRDEAARAGSATAEEFIRHLGRAVSAALLAFPGVAEATRAQVREIRATLHAAVDLRCDTLESSINTAEATKAASLERQLVAIDGALERWQSEREAIKEAVDDSRISEPTAKFSALSARLDGLEAQMRALSTAPIEPIHLALLADTLPLCARIASLGHVVAPCAVAASDLTAKSLPGHALAGSVLELHLLLSDAYTSQSSEGLEVALCAAAAATRVSASILVGDNTQQVQDLQATITADVARRGLVILLPIPPTTPARACACVRDITLAGIQLTGHAFPLTSLVIHGSLRVPMQLPGAAHSAVSSTPCFSSDCTLYVPVYDSENMLVFNADGSSLPPLNVGQLGLSRWSTFAAFVEGDSPMLLIADIWEAHATLVAVNPANRSVLWTTAVGDDLTFGCEGMSAIASRGVIIVGTRNKVFAHRLSDGKIIGSVETPCFSLAADPATAIVYIGGDRSNDFAVSAWTWMADCTFRSEGPVSAAGTSRNFRHLAVIPPAPGKRSSYLAIGTHQDWEIQVLSLPSLALVSTEWMEDPDCHVAGLVADPWGTALAVCDAISSSIHIVAWPLPQMPELE